MASGSSEGAGGGNPQPPATDATDVENRLADLLGEFRQEADSYGMHDQVVDLSERYIERAYRRGRDDCLRG